MITNNITNAQLSGIGIERNAPQVGPQNVEAYLATIEKAQKDLEKIDPSIASVDEQSADSEVLAMVAAHQKQVVQSMVGSNPEDAIALTLAAGIEACSARLEAIQQQAMGLGVFVDSMEAMWEDISKTSPLTGYALEDAFQLVLMDVLIHIDDYNLTADEKDALQRFMECGGSGMHGSHENYDQNEFVADLPDFLTKFMTTHPRTVLLIQLLIL